MTTVIDKKRKQDLGIYYTPEAVVDFIYAALNTLRQKEDEESQRWNSHKPAPHCPSIIDPAVGEGVFLKGALKSGFTKPQCVFGVDLDKEVIEQWEKINLLKSFGSKKDLEHHCFHQNSLLPLDKNKILRYKKAGLREFDIVVGNPPYGGVGLGETELTDELIAQLARFEVLPNSIKNKLITADTQSTLFPLVKYFGIKPEVKNRIKSFPIEVLFVDRFIQLAKPGGWIAIIIPDGILTNSNLHYVRKFIAQKTKVLAIVSLPRDTFKKVGTSAKTSILFLQKYREKDKRDTDYPVFLASIDTLEKEYFDNISNAYNSFHYNGTL